MKLKFLFFLVVLFFLALPALAYYNPGPPTGFVNDYSGTLTGEQKLALENKLSQFEKDASNEIAVAIIPSLQEDTIENFAVELFADWGIGKKDKDNGVLVLVAMADRKMRIEVGYGLEGALTDAQASWIISDVMRPAFREGRYYDGIDGAVDKIIGATKGEYLPSETKVAQGQIPWEAIVWFGIFFVFIVARVLGKSKSWWAGGLVGGVIGVIIGLIKGFLFFGLVSIAVLVPLGLLLDFLVSRNYQKARSQGVFPWWWGGHGGSGGSGGGFGGFGGGSSGGGGASGGW